MTRGPDATVVLASAGTGKTYRLTSRYLRLLALGEGVSSILATTFTRKAAGEIMQRVLARAAEASADPGRAAELSRAAGLEPGATPWAGVTARLARSLHRSRVVTIDSFFHGAARAMAWESGVRPDWRLASDEEDAALRDEAIEAALEAGGAAATYELLSMLAAGGAGRAVHGEVRRVVDAAHGAFLEARGDPDAWLVRTVGGRRPELSDRELGDLLDEIERAPLPLTNAGAPRKNWANGRANSLNAAREGDWEGLLKLKFAVAVARGDVFDKVEPPGALVGPVRSLVEHGAGVALRAFARSNEARRELLERFDAAYTEAKRARGVFRYEDVPRALLDAGVAGRLDELYFRLDARIRHVLLDEFQDTSVEQFRLLEPLIDEALAGGTEEDGARSVFCVGDVKQSLYMWRGAEPGLLAGLASRYPAFGEPESLDASWRSSRVVLDAVNGVFEGIGGRRAIDAARGAAGEFERLFHTHEAVKERAGRAALLAAPDGVRPIELAAERVGALAGEAPGARIAVLLRAAKEIPGLIAMLRRRGIPASEERGTPLTDAPAVAAALSLVRLADHPGDSAAVYHVASGPLGRVAGLTDPLDGVAGRRVSGALRDRLARDGYGATIGAWRRAVAPDVDDRSLRRLEQLATLGAEFDTRPGARPAEFVRLVESRRVDDPGSEPVRVMTLHASKGLEFDAVVLPDLAGEWSVRNDAMMMRRDDPFEGPTCLTRYVTGVLRSFDPDLEEIHARTLDRVVTGELCGLYVAMTRAVHVLEMILPHKVRDARCIGGRLLRETLAPGVDDEASGTLWSLESGDWAAEVRARDDRPADPEPTPVSPRFGRAPRRARAGRLETVAPSRLEGAGRVDGASLLDAGADSARRRGTLFHAWSALVRWSDDDPPGDDDLLRAASGAAPGADPGTLRPLIEDWRASVGRPGVRAALSRARYDGAAPSADALDVWIERPFAVRLARAGGAEALVRGVFDRVVVGASGGRAVWAEALDFKTDRAPDGDEDRLRELVAHYRPQVDAYRAAVSAMLGLEAGAVRAALVFLGPGRVVDLDAG